jgi:hypothetical protein
MNVWYDFSNGAGPIKDLISKRGMQAWEQVICGRDWPKPSRSPGRDVINPQNKLIHAFQRVLTVKEIRLRKIPIFGIPFKARLSHPLKTIYPTAL